MKILGVCLDVASRWKSDDRIKLDWFRLWTVNVIWDALTKIETKQKTFRDVTRWRTLFRRIGWQKKALLDQRNIFDDKFKITISTFTCDHKIYFPKKIMNWRHHLLNQSKPANLVYVKPVSLFKWIEEMKIEWYERKIDKSSMLFAA